MSANPHPDPLAIQAAMTILELAASPEAWKVFWESVDIALSDVNPSLPSVEEAATWEAWAALPSEEPQGGPTAEAGGENQPPG
ncbi:hypothetical protein ACFUIZ_14895 [Streptomyces cinereoruber]|uniref:hypothetical protein n=1 Tax=Streptomyces cinereoruber TaxID=67260 RepID=UPI0036347FEF